MQDDQNIIEQEGIENKSHKKRIRGIELFIGLFLIMVFAAMTTIPIIFGLNAPTANVTAWNISGFRFLFPNDLNYKVILGQGDLIGDLESQTNNVLRVNGKVNFSTELYLNNATPVSIWLYNQTYSGSTFNASYDTFDYNTTSAIVWNDLRNYPLSCPADTYVTQIDDSVTCSSVTYNYNQTYSGSTFNATYNTYAYNQSDGAGGISSSDGNRTYVRLDNVNLTYVRLDALNTTLSQWNSSTWQYNMSDNNQLKFNYNQTYSGNTYNSTYDKFAYNQSLTDAYNYSLATEDNLFDAFGIYWNNQTATIFNWISTNFFLKSSFRGEINNGTIKAIIGLGLVNVTSDDVTLNNTITLRVTNESSSYTPIKFGYNMSLATQNNFGEFWYNQSTGSFNQYGKFWYNMSLATQNNFGEFWYNQSLASFNQYGKFWINQTASFTYTGSNAIVKATSPTLSGTIGGALTWSGINTHPVNITMSGGNLTFLNPNQGVTFNERSRIYGNGSCLTLKGATSTLYLC